jgi:hypothetical protein
LTKYIYYVILDNNEHLKDCKKETVVKYFTLEGVYEIFHNPIRRDRMKSCFFLVFIVGMSLVFLSCTMHPLPHALDESFEPKAAGGIQASLLSLEKEDV